MWPHIWGIMYHVHIIYIHIHVLCICSSTCRPYFFWIFSKFPDTVYMYITCMPYDGKHGPKKSASKIHVAM